MPKYDLLWPPPYTFQKEAAHATTDGMLFICQNNNRQRFPYFLAPYKEPYSWLDARRATHNVQGIFTHDLSCLCDVSTAAPLKALSLSCQRNVMLGMSLSPFSHKSSHILGYQ